MNFQTICSLVGLLCALPGSGLAENSRVRLWNSAAGSVQPVAASEDAVIRRVVVDVRLSDFPDTFAEPLDLELPGFDREIFWGRVDRATRGIGANRVVSGHLLAEAGRFILVVDQDSLMADIRTESRCLQVVTTPGGVFELREIDQGSLPGCATTEAHAVRGPADEAGMGPTTAAASGSALIDVMVVYTAQARSAAGGVNAMESLIDMAIEQSNSAYLSSEVDLQIALVHTEEVAYTETGDMSLDLTRLAGVSDGFMDNIHLLRDVYGADLVALISNTGSACGIGYRMSSLTPSFASSGFTVSRRTCAVGNITFAHELGHNMGCHHDRDNAGSSIYPYAYGYRAPGAAFRTIMAYSPGTRIPYFSNPDVQFAGQPTGSPLGQATQTHNALTINNTAATIANFRSAELLDCNNNMIHDALDLFNQTSSDCDGNGIPDECDLDCNGNGVPDICDLAASASADCNLNGIPDECDIATGFSLDCNGNGVPDPCDLAFNTSADCDENGRPDECDIVESDCNANGVPDACDVAAEFVAASQVYSPFGANSPHQFIVLDPPPALGSVEVRVKARGDLNITSEYVSVFINGNDVGDAFTVGFPDCNPAFSEDVLVISAAEYNLWAATGALTIDLIASLAVSDTICSPPSQIFVTLAYPADAAVMDANGNGVPDSCELLTGDMNCDGAISVSDIGPFVLAITNAAAYEIEYPGCVLLQADANGDGAVTVSDIGDFVALVIGR